MGCFKNSKLIFTTAAIRFIDWLDASQAIEIHYLVSTGLRKFYNTPQARVDILITECFLKSCKRWLSSAMPRCHPIKFPVIVQRSAKTCYFRIWRCYQMESTEDKMNMLVHCH